SGVAPQAARTWRPSPDADAPLATAVECPASSHRRPSGRSPMRIRRLAALVPLGAMLAAAVPAHASITPDAQKVLDRYVEVSGGRAAWEQTRTVHYKGKLNAFGLQGQIESWRRSPDRHSSTVAIGPFTIRDWTSAGKAWRTDPSGKLLPLDGKDLDDALSDTWFDAERWLEPDQGGGTIATSADVKDSLGTRAVLDITPPVGRPRHFEFDRKSGLIVRTVSKNDQRTVVVVNSDFRKVAGWLTAFHSVQEVTGAAANTVTVQIDSVWTDETLADDRFVPPASAAGGITWLKTVNVARIPFSYHSRHV